MTTKTVIDLVTSCKMIFAKVLVYNPVVLEKMRGWLDVLKTQISQNWIQIFSVFSMRI